MIVKIDSEGCCFVDIEWDYNYLFEILEIFNFCDFFFECIERVLKLFESGYILVIVR